MAADLDALFAGAGLTEREDAAIRRTFAGGEKLRCVARSFGVTEGRASQIRQRAFEKLRAAA